MEKGIYCEYVYIYIYTVYIYISIYIRFTPPTQDAIVTPKVDPICVYIFFSSGSPWE